MSYYIVDGVSPYASAIVPPGETYNGYPVGWRQDPGTQEHEHLDPATEWVLVSDGGGSKRESYRGINSRSWPGIALPARLMGAVDLWADQAFFDYVDRWMTEAPTPYGTPSVGSTSSTFVSAMWDTYRYHGVMPGDADEDGDVDLEDFVILKQNFGRSPLLDTRADFDRDGDVDLEDFVALKQNFGAVAR
jgi:hypothetical protein